MAKPSRPPRLVVALATVGSLAAACGSLREVSTRDARTGPSVASSADAVVAPNDDEAPTGASSDLGSIATHTPTDTVQVVADGTAVVTASPTDSGTDTSTNPSTGTGTGSGSDTGTGSGSGSSTTTCATAQAGNDVARALTETNLATIEHTLDLHAAADDDGVIGFFPTVDTEVEFKAWVAHSLALSDGSDFPYLDGWCRAFGRYAADPASFTLTFTSAGEDGVFGTADDIKATWTGH